MSNALTRLENLLEVLDVGQLVDAFRNFAMSLSQYTQNLLAVFGVQVGEKGGAFFGLVFIGVILWAYFKNWKFILGAIILYVIAASMGVI